MRLASCVLIGSIAICPVQVLAGNQFVTVESIRFNDGAQVVATLGAGNDLQPNENGEFSFAGQIMLRDGVAVPLTVLIQTAGLTSAPTVDEYAETTGRVTILGRSSFSSSFSGVNVEKTIYTLDLSEDASIGTIVITDEPLPALVGWLAFAALASLTGVAVFAIESCSSVSLSASADLPSQKGEVKLECTN